MTEIKMSPPGANGGRTTGTAPTKSSTPGVPDFAPLVDGLQDPSQLENALQLLAARARQLGHSVGPGARARGEGPRGKVRFPRGNGPASAGRPEHALPPPHMALTRRDVEREEEAEVKARARAEALGLRELPARLPGWLLPFVERCHTGQLESELAQVSREHARALRLAASCYTETTAQRSVTAIGLALYWLSLRNRRRCGKVTNVGGLPVGALALLTRKPDGSHYSKSYIVHGTHDGSGERTGPRGGKRADPRTGQAGFLETLRWAKAIRYWTPPALAVPAWMRGETYACLVYRVASVTGADELLGALFSGSDPPPS